MQEKQQPERQLTPAQVEALGAICARYEVDFDEAHYFISPADSIVLPLWAQGWVGGPNHANPVYGPQAEPAGKPTIFVGVSPEGEVHS